MNLDKLLESEENWVTDMGAWFAGEKVILRGKNLFEDFRDQSWMELMMFTITGRQFDADQMRLLNCMWMWASSYPDPRIWNNRIAAYAGTARSTGVLGVAAGTAVSEASAYGKQVDMRAYDFISRMKTIRQAGGDLSATVVAELKSKRSLGGYGRPLINGDERIEPFLRLLAELDYDQLPHVQTALEIDSLLKTSRYRLSMNVAALAAAMAADQGLSRQEYYLYLVLAFSVGHLACYADAVNHTEGSFFPLRCSRIDYKGVKPRHWI